MFHYSPVNEVHTTEVYKGTDNETAHLAKIIHYTFPQMGGGGQPWV